MRPEGVVRVKEKAKEIIHWLGHASFRFKDSKGTIIYIDPYKLKDDCKKADIVLITHDHFDHFSKEDIDKIKKSDTEIFGPVQIKDETELKFNQLKAGEKTIFKGIEIKAVNSYNINKNFHPKESGNLGYIINIDGLTIYHAGDTDYIPEMKEIKTDIALLPIGGTYTMDIQEAIEAVKEIKPFMVIPMHYGSVVGKASDGETFKRMCSFCDVEVLPIA